MQLSGDLTKVSVPNLLQLVRTGALTGIISFNREMDSATLLVENGYPCHAEAEGLQGLEAILELFLWNSGTFAFNEEDVNFISVCTDFELTKCTLEYILKEGMRYTESKKFLEDIGISVNSILKPVEKTKNLHPPEMSMLDGKKTLKEALGPLNLPRSMFITTVADWIVDELAEPVSLGAHKPDQNELPGQKSLPKPEQIDLREVETIRLPPWVVARLRQENSDISRAIENMVVWTDRAKIWLYQLEGDFGKIRSVLERDQSSQQSQNAAQEQTQASEYGEVLTFSDDVENYPECGSASIDTDEPAELEEDLSAPVQTSIPPSAVPFTQDSYLQQGNYSYGFGSGMSSLGYFGQGRSNFSSFGGMRRHSYSSDATMFSLDHRSYDKDVMSNQRQPDLPNMEVVYDSDDGGL